MAEEGEISEQKGETLMKKMDAYNYNKIDENNDDTTSSSSSSVSDDEKKARKKSPVATASSPPPPERGNKSKIYRFFGREKPVHNVFGGAKPADVFLWRNKKISASVIGGVTVVWVLFEILGYHLITLICHILIVALAILFLWSNVSTFINKSPPRFPEVHLPEGPFLHIASVLRIEINQTFAVLREIASGRDLKKFLGIIAGLWVLSVVGGWCNFLTLFYITFVLLHTVPVLYEKYEDKIDPIAEKGIIEIKKQYAVFNAKVLSKIPRGPSKEKKAE